MSDLSRFRALAPQERLLVCVGVLLDGQDAVDYLASDKERGLALTRAAGDLAELPLDLRVPLLGSSIRSAISELERKKT